MNIVLPFDFQSSVPIQQLSGSADMRAENAGKSTISPLQDASAAKSSEQRPSSQQQTQYQDKVHISEAGKKAAEEKQDNELSEEDQKEVQTLKDRDREVKIHEQAHAAVGGQYAGSPQYEYETGPDGKRYAVGGEVSIDVGEEAEPEDTVQKMQIVRAAALAPAEPSTQDLKVAAEASQKEQRARAEVSQQQLSSGPDEDAPASDTNSQSRSLNVNTVQAYADIANISAPPRFTTSA